MAMSLNIAVDRALRTPDELTALVKAVVEANPDDGQETRWLEWKSSLDFNTAAGRFAIAKAILGFANRDPELAALTCEGVAYMIVGAEPQSAPAGFPQLDHAALGQQIKTYADGPRWTPHYVDLSGVKVLVVVVEPPRYGDHIYTLQKTYQSFCAGTVFHRRTAHTEPAGPKELAMLEERRVRGIRAPELDLDIDVDAEPLTRLKIDREGVRDWLNRRETYIQSSRRPPLPPTHGTGIFSLQTGPDMSGDRAEFQRRIREHLSQCRERLVANLFREVADSMENKAAFIVKNQTEEAIEGVQLTVRIPAGGVGVYPGVPSARPMPQLPSWPDARDSLVRATKVQAPLMDSLAESFMTTRTDAKVTTRDGFAELTYDIGNLRPGELLRTPPATIIIGPAAPGELGITLTCRSMNRRGEKSVSTALAISSQRWEIDYWVSAEVG